MIAVVIVVDIEVVLAAMTMGTGGLRDAPHIEVVGTTPLLLGALLTLENQEGIELGHLHILLIIVRTGTMLIEGRQD